MSKSHKKYVRFIAAVAVIVTLLTCFTTTVHATNEEETAQSAHQQAVEQLKNDFKVFIFDIAYATRSVAAFIIDLTKPILLFGKSDGLRATIEAVQSAAEYLGKLLCFLYFLLELAEHATRDSFSAEAFVKSLGKLMIMCVLFSGTTINQLTEFLSTVGSYLVEKLANSEPVKQGIAAELISELKKTPAILAWMVLFKTGTNAGGGLGILIMMIAATFVSVGRLIEKAVYVTLLPLGMASIYSGGVHSPGFRYFKKCLALEIQGAVIIATCITAEFIFTKGGLDLFGVVQSFAIGLAGTAIICRSKQIANDVAGV